MSHKVSRRLAAILAADIAGYSRLMGEGEVATVRDLKGPQADVIPLVAESRRMQFRIGINLGEVIHDDHRPWPACGSSSAWTRH